MVLNLTLTESGIDAERVSFQRLESVRREIEVTPSHGVLTQEAVEIIDLRPDIAVVILQLHIVAIPRRQVDRDTSHALRRAVADTVADRRLEGDDPGEAFVGAERQTEMDTFVLVDLQNLLYVTDVHGCAGGYISGGGDGSKEFRDTDDRKGVEDSKSGVGRGSGFACKTAAL